MHVCAVREDVSCNRRFELTNTGEGAVRTARARAMRAAVRTWVPVASEFGTEVRLGECARACRGIAGRASCPGVGSEGRP